MLCFASLILYAVVYTVWLKRATPQNIVIGGAVKGGQIYGSYPTLALAGPDDSGSNGRWVPSTASSQYAATLAQWFGVPAAALPTILPSIGNFSSSNLGFV